MRAASTTWKRLRFYYRIRDLSRADENQEEDQYLDEELSMDEAVRCYCLLRADEK